MKRGFVILMAAVLLAAGCAKVPVENVVAKKNTEQIVEKALSEANAADNEALYQRVGAPKSYAEEIPVSSDRMHVSIDAEVILPALNKMGIYEVSASGISQEFAETAYQYFCGAVNMYPASSSFTRDWYETEIGRIQKNLADQTLDASARESAEGYLALLEQEMEAAPISLGEPVEHVQFYTEQAEGNGQYTCFQATERAFPERGRRFSVTNDTVYATDGVQYQVDGWKTVAPRSDAILEYRDTSVYQGDFSNVREISEHEQAENISLSPSEAKAQAQKVLDDLGLTDMFIESIYTVDNAVEAEATGMDTRYAYCITAYRAVSQIPVRSAGYASYVGSLEDGHE